MSPCASKGRPFGLRMFALLAVWMIGPAQGADSSPLPGDGPVFSGPCDAAAIRNALRLSLLASGADAFAIDDAADRSEATGRSFVATESRVDPATRVPPGLAFLMSAVLPGSGQLAEGRRRAFLYLGLEAFAWISHFAWTDAGNKKEGEFEAFARQHWNLDQWRSLSYGDVDSCRDALPPGIDPAEAEATLRRFQAEGNLQHYYEDIGKLEAYRAGWDDFACASPETISPNRRTYREMRADSNKFLERARLASTVAFLNRVVSAVDAYRTSRGARLQIAERTSLEIGVGGTFERPRASLRVRRRW